jgi:primosomal protein N'
MVKFFIKWVIDNYAASLVKTIFTAARNVIKGKNQTEHKSTQVNKDLQEVPQPEEPIEEQIPLQVKKPPRKMTIEEAKALLEVTSSDPSEISKKFKNLMSLNDPSLGGSFYLQCKLIGAKEVLNNEKLNN